MDQHQAQRQLTALDGVSEIVRHPLVFKAQLGIGGDAYSSLWLGKRLQSLWDVGGVAAAGAGVAQSSTVAAMFFAPTGWLSAIGLGAAAATPVAWVAAAAVASAGAYYGITRLVGEYSADRVTQVPRFINTPLDILAASLFDLFAPLFLKVAGSDGAMNAAERAAILAHFERDWGYDPAYCAAALEVIAENTSDARLDRMAEALQRFLADNPDCNVDHIRGLLVAALTDLAGVDGAVSEAEEMAIERIERSMISARPGRLARLRRRIGRVFSAKKRLSAS